MADQQRAAYTACSRYRNACQCSTSRCGTKRPNFAVHEKPVAQFCPVSSLFLYFCFFFLFVLRGGGVNRSFTCRHQLIVLTRSPGHQVTAVVVAHRTLSAPVSAACVPCVSVSASPVYICKTRHSITE